MNDIYEELLIKIAKHPMGAPRHPAILTILKELFTPVEARLASRMSLKALEVADIAERGEMLPERALFLLENMANKGIIYCDKAKGQVRYALMPPMPGFFEFSLVKGEDTPRNRKLGQLWDEYFTGALGDAMHATAVPMSRVVPIKKKVAYGMEIFPYEEAAEIVKKAEKIALGQCQCRFSVRKCDAPLDVCILLDNWADFLTDRNLARPIGVEEAIDALKRSEEAGLVHTTPNTKTPVPYICNCCSCCCFMLRGVTELGRKSLASSRFRAVVDEDACTGCEACAAICGFKAIEINDENTASVSLEDCMGCGLCTSVCPEDSISMIQRENAVIPYDKGAELMMDMARHKGALEPMKKG
ncbi:MAG: 4Fe-4S binding protein [Deltaproteobacteria bacterium]|nr:4Fe-4S binding protein [Deltaproteobacteria bacterium]MBW1941961.1 4Fe-4S binding protein [Deltaproteobacteria bacterium]